MTSATTDRAHWVFVQDTGRIALRMPQGIVEPGAMTIWEAEFDGRTEFDGLAVGRPSNDLPEIGFARAAAEVVLVAAGSMVEGLRLYAALMSARKIELPVPAPSQIVVDGRWTLIDQDALHETEVLLTERGISIGGRINIGQLVWLRAADSFPLDFVDLSTDIDASRVSLPKVQGLLLSAGTVLYPYQESGVAFLSAVASESLGCVLADEMGLGKTLQIIALLSLERSAGRGPSLIVCPATLLENWRRELSDFAPHISTLVHAGHSRTGNAAVFANFDVVIVSYETAVRDEPLLSSVDWNVLALDEAQNIKNPDAQRTAAVKALPRRVSVAVTGTPVENRLTDLWSISDFVLPGLLGRRSDFELAFDDTHEDATMLAPLVAPILLRRRVAEVATDLPPRIDVPQAVSMTGHLAGLYEDIREDIVSSHASNATLVALGKLRQFCCHPKLLGVSWGDPAEGMPKYRRLTEILEEIFSLGQKALIFTSFTQMADILLEDIPRRFRAAWSGLIDGRIPVEERQQIVDQFSAHIGYGILVLNPKAAGVGLNITAANHVIHYNPEWNPALEDQASARAHRRKQKLPVTIHHLFFADSVEEVVVDRLHFKRSIAADAVVGHAGNSDVSDIARALRISPLAKKDLLE